MKCTPGSHAWIAGMMYVNEEDVPGVMKTRNVECEKCEHILRKLESGEEPDGNDYTEIFGDF